MMRPVLISMPSNMTTMEAIEFVKSSLHTEWELRRQESGYDTEPDWDVRVIGGQKAVRMRLRLK